MNKSKAINVSAETMDKLYAKVVELSQLIEDEKIPMGVALGVIAMIEQDMLNSLFNSDNQQQTP